MSNELSRANEKFWISFLTLIWSIRFNNKQVTFITGLARLFHLSVSKKIVTDFSFLVSALMGAVIAAFFIWLWNHVIPWLKKIVKCPEASMIFEYEDKQVDELRFIADDPKFDDGKVLKYTFCLTPKGVVSFYVLKWMKTSFIVKFNPQVVQIEDAEKFDHVQEIKDGRVLYIPIIGDLDYKKNDETCSMSLKIVPIVRNTRNSDIKVKIRGRRRFLSWISMGWLVSFVDVRLRIFILSER